MANSKKLLVTAIAAVILLTGCGADSTNQASSTPVAQGNGGDIPQDQRGQAPGQGQGRSPMMGADLLGKIKSVNGETITVYKSSFVPGERGQGGGPQPPGDNAQPPSGEGNQPPQGEGQNRPNMENMFSEETSDIQITPVTKIVKIAFENQQRTETELTAAELKADDIVSVDLEDNTQNAVTITISEGGFGGMGGMGGGPRGQRQQQGQQHGDAPAAEQSNGN
ncbi:hypothetical protein [Cohnella cholangitidis]|uniref:Uncharacterized protein n=1 Tax=Cohnella cholangitidis TaxID=2598458 RepID=A0A7G5BW46_9BACL|nr:hypothetical protein [Cohnella cholangitidis]QMV41180.1 hypothetical protein FPL14_08210 [Cohnella cholangitidis]